MYEEFIIGIICGAMLCGSWLTHYARKPVNRTECIYSHSVFPGLMKVAGQMLEVVLVRRNVPNGHGFDHAISVLAHAINAISVTQQALSNDRKFAIELAALLHDADDRKYFPKNQNFENARNIVRIVAPGIEELVITMIVYISASKNQNNVPEDAVNHPWLLYPRWADRLEAIGWTGVVRAWDYAIESNLPLFTDRTARVRDELPLFNKIATKKRFDEYSGKSESMIDHYYDKLLRVCDMETDNAYFLTIARMRCKPLVAVCLAFGDRGGSALGDDVLSQARALAKDEQNTVIMKTK